MIRGVSSYDSWSIQMHLGYDFDFDVRLELQYFKPAYSYKLNMRILNVNSVTVVSPESTTFVYSN